MSVFLFCSFLHIMCVVFYFSLYLSFIRRNGLGVICRRCHRSCRHQYPRLLLLVLLININVKVVAVVYARERTRPMPFVFFARCAYYLRVFFFSLSSLFLFCCCCHSFDSPLRSSASASEVNKHTNFSYYCHFTIPLSLVLLISMNICM